MSRLETLASVSGNLVITACPDCGQRLVMLRPAPCSWAPGPAHAADKRACSGCSAMWQINIYEVSVPGQAPLFYANFLPLDPSTLLPR